MNNYLNNKYLNNQVKAVKNIASMNYMYLDLVDSTILVQSHLQSTLSPAVFFPFVPHPHQDLFACLFQFSYFIKRIIYLIISFLLQWLNESLLLFPFFPSLPFLTPQPPCSSSLLLLLPAFGYVLLKSFCKSFAHFPFYSTNDL